jgi:hypothetical protein
MDIHDEQTRVFHAWAITADKIAYSRPVVLTRIPAAGQAVVYSWQPALLAQRLTDPRVAFEPIPAFLVNRFGARSSAATGGRP